MDVLISALVVYYVKVGYKNNFVDDDHDDDEDDIDFELIPLPRV